MTNRRTQSAEESLDGTIRRVLAEHFGRGSGDSENWSESEEIYHSPEGVAKRHEIVWNAQKLWQRQYVDGNGGNLSCRIGEQYVLCTPSMCSKADLTVDDLCLVDLDGKEVFGPYRRTSELLLHLQIYRSNPSAQAVVHCHPPHATAYAIAGIAPAIDLVPEQEVFIGPVAIAPYETPGTQAFAETILPFVEKHNTILLANHGVVCWADTVTHAEWLVEVLDTYCRTLILAAHLGAPARRIAPEKIQELLQVKRQLGLPDARFAVQPEAGVYPYPKPLRGELFEATAEEVDVLARRIAEAVRGHLAKNGSSETAAAGGKEELAK